VPRRIPTAEPERLSSRVTVRAPCGAGSRDGGGMPRTAASPAITRKSGSRRSYWRQQAPTVSTRATNRLPSSLSEPERPLRHSAAGRSVRSDTLPVGSTPSTRANVPSAAHHVLSSRQSPAALESGLPPDGKRTAYGLRHPTSRAPECGRRAAAGALTFLEQRH
jgi:hypothetical protein